MKSEVVTLTRAQLYEQVWATPMCTLAPRYGMSDVGLAKLCQRLNIPRPPVGYWAKKEFGKAPPRPKLPDAAEPQGDAIEVFISSEPEASQEPEFFDAELRELYEHERMRKPLTIITPSCGVQSRVRPRRHVHHCFSSHLAKRR